MRVTLLAIAASLPLALPALGAAPDGAAAPAPAPAPPAAGKAPAHAPQPPAPPTEAELKCQAEVAAALEKQRKAGQYRMETDMLSQDGPMKMKVEYILPNRMRQVVSLVTNPQPVETVVIDSKAWSNAGEGWEPLAPDVVKQLVEQMSLASSDEAATASRWSCLGSKTVEGREMTAYEGKDATPKDVSPGGATMPQNEASRIMFVDPATGLPERGVFARKDKLDKPFFKAVYTYPTDIKIEAPAEVK